MKQEWQDISTAPKNMTVCILDSSGYRCSGYKRGDDKWVTENNKYYLDKDFIMWYPFPRRPIETRHKCDGGDFSCQSIDNGYLVLVHRGITPRYEQLFVKFCPFCGLKAEKVET